MRWSVWFSWVASDRGPSSHGRRDMTVDCHLTLAGRTRLDRDWRVDETGSSPLSVG